MRMRQRVRRWRLHRRTSHTLTDLAQRINPVVRGWMQYYGAFYRSELDPLLRRINAYLVRLLRMKYRRLRSSRKARACWQRVTSQQPGLSPTGRGKPASGDQDAKSRMNREIHVRIRGSRGLKCPGYPTAACLAS